MSIIRWGTEGSQVYIYENPALGYTCHSTRCRITDLADANAMLAHAKGHRALGDRVPERVLRDLQTIVEGAEGA